MLLVLAFLGCQEIGEPVPSNKDPNTSLSFVFDPLDNIAKAFISTSVRTSNGGISSNIYDVHHKNIAEIDHRPDGTFTVKFRGGNRPHGWWREWDDCLGTVGAPFPSNFANIVFETVATVSTGGLWVPSLFLVCAGVASGRNYQNRN